MQLTPEQKQFILQTLQKFLPAVRILLFGSRYRHNAKPYSDADIALDTGHPIPLTILSELEEQFSNSDLPFKVELVDMQRVTAEFKQHILENSQLLD